MKRVYVFVEGPTDAELLQRVLPPELSNDVQVVEAGGSDRIPSLARSVLVRRQAPVAVLMDSDSLDPNLIEERRGGTEELIQAAASAIPVKVIAAVPEIEAWLFAAPEVIERTLEEKVDGDLVSLGKRDPKGVLELLASRSQKVWNFGEAIRQLDENDIARIRALPEVTALIEFIRDVQKNGRAA
jgi:hypothetical protein